MRLIVLITAIVTLSGLGVLLPVCDQLVGPVAGAVNKKGNIKEGFKMTGDPANNPDVEDEDKDKIKDLNAIIKDATSALFLVVGVLSVIMLIVGGIRYTTSSGIPEQIKAAKSTIMYSLIGVAVASLAYAIVNFIVNRL